MMCHIRKSRLDREVDTPSHPPFVAPSLAETLGEMLAVHDGAGAFACVSSASRRLLGYEPHELLGRHPRELLHRSSQGHFDEALAALASAKVHQPITVRMHHKAGWQVWIEVAGRKSDTDSEVIFVYRDVTLRRLAEEALRFQERTLRAEQLRLNTIIAQLPAIIWTTDTDFRVLTLAGGALRTIPLCTGDVIGRPIGELLDALTLDENGDMAREGTATVAHRRALLGDSVGFDLFNFREFGRDLDVMIEPLLDDDRAVVGCLGFALDVTERHRARKAEQERRDLQDAVAAMERVLGVIGHELRTPLAALRVMAEHLLEDRASTCPGKDAGPFLQTIHDEVIRLSKMLNDLLDAAHVPHEAAVAELTNISVSELCGEALQTVAPLVDQRHVRIECEVVPNDLAINASQSSIRRLVVNLLSNAQRHTKHGSIELRVAQVDERFIELVVRDSGAGIPAHLVDKLGVPFALSAGVIGGGHDLRQHGASDHSEGRVAELAIGSGLGLAICNRIAAAHGGSLRIDSEVGRGTTVTVRLRADLVSVPEMDSPLRRSGAEESIGRVSPC